MSSSDAENPRTLHKPISREQVIQRIELLTSYFIRATEENRLLDFEVRTRIKQAMSFDPNLHCLVHSGKKKIIRLNTLSARKYTAIWIVLAIVHRLLYENKTVTQRQMYYMDSFFRVQSEANEAILDVSCILQVPRSALNIVAATRGAFVGQIQIFIDGYWQDCRGVEEHPITQATIRLQPLEICSSAEYIIIIEKDGILSRLREDKFIQRLPCILITGRGFPDLATRAFVRLLSDTLEIPVLGLCDCNPYGLSVMLTYKIGSARMPLEAEKHAVDIKWMGLRPSQLPILNLPESTRKPLSQRDYMIAKSLFDSPFIRSDPQYVREVAEWTRKDVTYKVDLEGLHSLSFGFLQDLLYCLITNKHFI